MFEESNRASKKKFSVGDKVRGEVLVVGKEDVFVAIGRQSEGTLSRRDVTGPDGNPTVKVGDMLDLYVTQVRAGEVQVSTNRTAKNVSNDLEDAFDMMLPVEGRVAEVCKGGFRVSIHGKLAFCPISQMDLRHIENPEEYVGKRFEFRITQFSEGGRNVVVSRRKLLDEERGATEGSFLAEHKAGAIVPGRIKRLEKFGAFVEVAPGLEGLAHISELSWSRIGDPSEVVTVGQEVQVKILKIERDAEGRTRISLSVKQTGDKPGDTQEGVVDPWQAIAQKYPVGTQVTGKVERKEIYGLFIQLEPGLTGLLHKSKTQEQPEFPFEKLKVGQEVTVQIGELRASERRISLSLPRDPGSDDWKSYSPKGMGSFGSLGDQLKTALEKKAKSQK